MAIMVMGWFIYILSSLWVQVQIDVKINEWFGQFYDMIQKALAAQTQSQLESTGQACYHLLH